uniref:Uncharacterized protein n=1 Tax=Abalone asfa-like virus TaxID=2839893 RepID=A0A5K7XX51_9VIRU|nr:hypothetical protein [Abalone asfa-like virus]
MVPPSPQINTIWLVIFTVLYGILLESEMLRVLTGIAFGFVFAQVLAAELPVFKT